LQGLDEGEGGVGKGGEAARTGAGEVEAGLEMVLAVGRGVEGGCVCGGLVVGCGFCMIGLDVQAMVISSPCAIGRVAWTV
jgi:hypothetical protein